MTRELPTVIWDLDGTLVDTLANITNTVNLVRDKFGLDNVGSDIIIEYLNGTSNIKAVDIFGVAEDKLSSARELFGKYYEIECVKDIELYSKVEDTLHILSDKGYKLCVATNGSLKYAQMILEELQIITLFDCIVGSDSVTNPKPAPDMLIKALGDSDISKSVMVGDSPKDIIAAKRANIMPLFANWGYGKIADEVIILNRATDILKVLP